MKISYKKVLSLYYGLLFTLLLSNRAFPQNDIKYYLASALRKSPVIEEHLQNIKLREIDRSLNNAQYNLPQLSLTASYLFAPYFNNKKLITTAPDPSAIGYDPSITNGGLYSAQINLTKNLFNSQALDIYNEQSNLQINSSKNQIEQAKHTLEKDVTDQYISCKRSNDLYNLSKALADTIKKQLRITESLMQRGLAKQTDYLLLKIELNNQAIVTEQALIDFKTNLSALNNLCGIFDTLFVELKNTDLEISAPAAESNFLKQYSIDSLIITNQQAIYETKYFPQVSVFANAGLNAVELNGINKRFGLSAGLNFSYPLFDGGQKELTRQQSEIASRVIGIQEESQRINILSKKNESAHQIEFYKNSIKAVNNQIDDYMQVIKLSRLELQQGQVTMIEYITILRNYLDLRRKEIESYAGYQQAINQFNYWNW